MLTNALISREVKAIEKHLFSGAVLVTDGIGTPGADISGNCMPFG